VTELRTVRVAAIQATPVILDAEASVAKAVRLFEEAAAGGAELAVLPETFVPLYPSNRWARGAAAFGGWDGLWERLHENAVEVPGPLVDELAAACSRLGLHAVVGSTSAPEARSTTRTSSSGQTASSTGIASSCRRSTSGSSTESGRATTSAWSTPRSAVWAG
jgi:predicted amidohydrolase